MTTTAEEMQELHERVLGLLNECMLTSAKLPGHEEYAAEVAPIIARFEKGLALLRRLGDEEAQP